MPRCGGSRGPGWGHPAARSIPGGNPRGKLARGFPTPSSQGKIEIIISKWGAWRGCSRQRRSRFIDGTAEGTAEPAAGQGSPVPAARAAASPGVPRPPPPPGKPRRGSPARRPRSPAGPLPASGAEGVNRTLSIGLYFLKKFIRFLQGDQKRVLAFPQAPSKQSPGLKIQNFV